MLEAPKKADSYWSAPPEYKKPVISITRIGYVRSSEVMCIIDPMDSRGGDCYRDLQLLAFLLERFRAR
jgi:hypothetical protein